MTTYVCEHVQDTCERASVVTGMLGAISAAWGLCEEHSDIQESLVQKAVVQQPVVNHGLS